MSRDYRANLPPIDDQTNTDIAALLSSVPDDKRKEMLARIRPRRDKLPLSSDITNQVISVCGTLLGFGAAGVGLSVGFADKIRQLPPIAQKIIVAAGIVYSELAAVSLMALVLYMIQARFRYPFLYLTKTGNTWPWFYYATISPDISRRAVQTNAQLLDAARHYAADFIAFANKAIGETPGDELRNELQQYYLLIAYQGYVQQFSLRLTNLFFYGLIGSIGAAVFLLFRILYA
jgi:hypothetical protein